MTRRMASWIIYVGPLETYFPRNLLQEKGPRCSSSVIICGKLDSTGGLQASHSHAELNIFALVDVVQRAC